MSGGCTGEPAPDNFRCCFRESAATLSRHGGLAGSLDRPGRGRSPPETTPNAPGRHPDPARRGDRHLQEHPLATGIRPAQAQPRTAPPSRPGPSGATRRTRRRTRGRRPSHPAQASTPKRPCRLPADPAVKWRAGVEGDHPARARANPSFARTRATNGSTSSRVTCD